MEVTVDGETEIECECPKCGHKYTEIAHVEITGEVEPSDLMNEGYS